jgi:hypothetical protein
VASNQSELKARWEAGLALTDAAFAYATEREQNLRRKPAHKGAFEARMMLMTAALFDKIYKEELIAIGIRVSSDASTALEIIPALLFGDSSREAISRALSGPASTLQFAGRQWESVRIVEPRQETAILPTPPKKERGRPRVDSVLSKIVRFLHEEGRLQGLLRKEQEAAVRDEARAAHSDLFPKPSQPSRQKILEALSKCAPAFSGSGASKKSKKSK